MTRPFQAEASTSLRARVEEEKRARERRGRRQAWGRSRCGGGVEPWRPCLLPPGRVAPSRPVCNSAAGQATRLYQRQNSRNNSRRQLVQGGVHGTGRGYPGGGEERKQRKGGKLAKKTPASVRGIILSVILAPNAAPLSILADTGDVITDSKKTLRPPVDRGAGDEAPRQFCT